MDLLAPITWVGHQSHPLSIEPSSTVLSEDDELRCAYASKKCFNVRTTKKGGGLHRFCEFHRRRANKNQWRVDDKRRVVRAERRQQLKRLRAAATRTPTHDPLRRDPNELLAAEIALTHEELKLLQEILFDDEEVPNDKAHSMMAPHSPSCVGSFVV